MKRILLLLLTAWSISAGAQELYRQWNGSIISKTYYKFRVGVNGIYRINASALATIGLENVNADHFQLWRNGAQVAHLYFCTKCSHWEARGIPLNSGIMNDGKPDKPLYREADYQLF